MCARATRATIATSFAELIGKSKISALDLAASYRDLSEQLRKLTCEKVDDEYGLDIPQLNIVNVSFPEEVEKALDTRTSMGVVGDMNQFQQFQMGYASAMAWILFAIVLALTLLVLRSSKLWVYYEGERAE